MKRALDDKGHSIKNIEGKDEGGLRIKGYFNQLHAYKPLISIVTVVYNGEKYLEQTIRSVIYQPYENLEYIIIDGGSTDRTVEIIKKYEKEIDYWISEKDTGIYDAMNKGIHQSMGEYIAFINADDWYEENVVQKVANVIMDSEVDFLYADINYVFDDGSFSIWKGNTRNNGTRIPHPSCFIRASLLKEEGFNERYKIVADYEMTLRLFHKNVKVKYLDLVIANFRPGGISSAFYATTIEDFLVTKKYFGLVEAIKNLIIKIYSYTRKFLRGR